MLYAIKHAVPNHYLTKSGDDKRENALTDDTVYSDVAVVERLWAFARSSRALTQTLFQTVRIVPVQRVNAPMYEEITA